MAKIKISKKELREDEVKNWGFHAFEWIKENSTPLIIAISICVIALVGIKLYQYRTTNINNQANFLYKAVLDSYYRGIVMTDAEKKADREKLFDETVTKADSLISTFPGHPLAQASKIIKGTVLYYKNNFDEAATVFQAALSSAKSAREKAEALLGLGYTYENKHFYTKDVPALQKAEESYSQAIDTGKGTEIAYEAMLCKARILEQKLKTDDAIKLYEQVIAECKQEPAKEDSRFKVGTWQHSLQQRFSSFSSVFSFAKDAEFALDRLKGSAGI